MVVVLRRIHTTKLKLANSCFHTTNFHTSKPRSQDLSSFGRKSGDPVKRGYSKRLQVKCEIANSKKWAKKLARIETSFICHNSLPAVDVTFTHNTSLPT